MRDMLGAPIAYDFFFFFFYYTEKTFRLTATYATADDLLALGMAKNLMELYKDTPVYNAALNLLESISAPLQDEEDSEWFRDRIIIPKIAAASIDEETWKGIVEALRRNRVITFQYSGNQSPVEDSNTPYKRIVIRRVRPYQLLFDRSDWYLFAFDEDRDDMRIFALPRIKSIAVTNTKFNIPAKFDYRRLEGLSYFAIFSGAKVYRFKIAITGDARWIKERLWADDQKIKETRNGIEISFTSNQLDRVLDWALSLTPRARPLAPKILVERWTKAILEAAKIAKK
jgi:predicted DNA-binding transcriptional regulator YafY